MGVETSSLCPPLRPSALAWGGTGPWLPGLGVDGALAGGVAWAACIARGPCPLWPHARRGLGRLHRAGSLSCCAERRAVS